jgi:hypothetical protein
MFDAGISSASGVFDASTRPCWVTSRHDDEATDPTAERLRAVARVEVSRSSAAVCANQTGSRRGDNNDVVSAGAVAPVRPAPDVEVAVDGADVDDADVGEAEASATPAGHRDTVRVHTAVKPHRTAEMRIEKTSVYQVV